MNILKNNVILGLAKRNYYMKPYRLFVQVDLLLFIIHKTQNLLVCRVLYFNPLISGSFGPFLLQLLVL